MRFRSAIVPALCGAIALLGAACRRGGEHAPTVDVAPPDPLAPLHTFEEERRAATDFARVPPSDHALGPDPIAIRALPDPSGGAHFAGLLRGRDAVVLLDEGAREIARADAPGSPTGIAIAPDGEIFVAGEQGRSIARYRARGRTLERTGSIDLEGAVALRDLTVWGRKQAEVIHAVEEHDGHLLTIPLVGKDHTMRATRVGEGPFRVSLVHDGSTDRLIVDCLLDHTLVVIDLDEHGLPRPDRPVHDGVASDPIPRALTRAVVKHDGPIWGFDALATPEGLLVAAGGVEDHPLDRTEGSFAFVDSFVFLYRVPRGGPPERLAAVNVSSAGVITPKALLLHPAPGGGLAATVTGYGADALLEIAWGADRRAPPSTTTRRLVPGAAAMATSGGALVVADPLLDAWIRLAPGDASPAIVPVPDGAARSHASRIGEALFFTNLMAPWNSSEGGLSRFTCETCHFEGYVDGRTHHTGRGDVHATTKPLLGLFNNRPHFSRALDPDMATMVNNEFRVAGARSGHDPWFSAPRRELPWIGLLGAPDAELEPLALRRALMTFLMELSHRPNPAALGRSSWSDLERRGAAAFARHCESCHRAQLASDAPGSRVPFDRWEALVMSREGPIVWGSIGYHKTGVEPYVHPDGARAPSLRRLYKKRPYFTNGSARTVRDVLDRVRWEGGAFFHDRGPEGAARLDEGDREALAAFLDLL